MQLFYLAGYITEVGKTNCNLNTHVYKLTAGHKKIMTMENNN